MKLRTFKEAWGEYCRLVISESGVEPGSAQFCSLERSFHAGGLAMFSLLCSSDGMDEDEAMAHLNSIYDELEAYVGGLVISSSGGFGGFGGVGDWNG